MKIKYANLMIATLLFTITIGCSSESGDRPAIGHVVGTVTLNAEPQKDLLVTFIPSDGRPSSAVTDEMGSYELIYIGSDKGAKIGDHTVRITTLDIGEPGRPNKEQVPEKFNSKTELNAKVIEGENVFDFSL